MREHLKWYDDKADCSPWIDALAELRQRATREGHCYQLVQAITVAIDQYAEKALGNREYFSQTLRSLDLPGWLLNEKAPAISTDSWGRQPRVFLPAGLFGGKNRKL